MLVLEFLGEIDAVHVSTMKASKLEYLRADELHVMIRSQEGTVAHIGLSFNSTMPIHTMQVVGSKGMVALDLFTQSTVYHKLPHFVRTDQLTMNSLARGRWAVSDIWQRTTQLGSTTAKTLLGEYRMGVEGHKYLIRRCLDSILKGTAYPVDLAKAREVVSLVEMVGENVREKAS